MISIPIPHGSLAPELQIFLQEILRRSVDGTITPLFTDNTNFRVGIKTVSPAYTLDVNGTMRVTGAVLLQSTVGVTGDSTFTGDAEFAGEIVVAGEAAPAVSAAGKATIYFDSTSKTLKLSVDGGAYADFSTGSGSTDGILVAMLFNGMPGGAGL